MHTGLFLTMTGAVIWQGIRNLRITTGIRRLEVQFVVLNFGVSTLLSAILIPAGNLFGVLGMKLAATIILLISLVTTASALAFHRIFDVRHVLRFLALRLAIGVVLAVGISASCILFAGQSPGIAVIAPVAGVWGLIAMSADFQLRRWLRIDDERKLAALRTDVISLARSEPGTVELVAHFKVLLQEKFDSPRAFLLFENVVAYNDSGISLRRDSDAYAALLDSAWATPESLQRRRSSPGLNELSRLIEINTLAAIVPVPRGSPSPSLVVALMAREDESPFTYPEVVRLQAIAELMDNILTHSRLTSQAALQAKIEHLAMMSRGLAHDLKNLITPVSSFLIHTDGRFPPESPEAEVHAAARRSMRVMTDYVRDALFFSERLQPKLENVDLPKLLDTVRELTVDRAGARGVTVFSSVDLAEPVVADGVLLQRMLVNLVSNAIDASARGQTVALSASQTPNDWLKIVVRDEGCGISTENMTRIFEPYFTTKQFGEDVRGFGLGLTICQKITNLHGGLISVESKLGKGTHVTVNLPTSAVSRRLLPGPPCLALP